jgi:NTE family protein
MGICKSKKNEEKIKVIFTPDTPKQLQEHKWDFNNIVIEGASTNGLVTVGAYKVLERAGVLKQLSQYAGSSSGSIFAALAAVHATADYVDQAFMKFDMESLKDGSVGVVRDISRLVNEYGFYKGDALEKWVEQMLYTVTKIRNITFKQIYDKYGSTLVITRVNLSEMCVEYMNPYNTPNKSVSNAIRHSTCIPLLFKAALDGTDICVDGAFGDPYPIDVFDHKPFSVDETNKTFGLKIMSKKNEERTAQIRTSLGYNITNLGSYISALITFATVTIERLKIDEHYWERTITLNSPDRNIGEFDITTQEKIQDINSGVVDTISALQKFIEIGHF